MKEGIILGMGNPLLDIAAPVEKSLLEKYELDDNLAILAEEKHQPLYADLVASYNPEYIAGGATQNSIRVAQWMMQTPGATSFFGAVGDDDYAAKMTASSKKDGVNVQYFTNPEMPTGTCAVLITGKHRALVANLAAANTYKISHLKEADQWGVVERANIYYISGFFLTVSPDSMLDVARHSDAENKTFCFNLSAPFLMQVPPFFESMKSLLPWVDILFGSETEAAELAKAMGWDVDPTDVAAIVRKAAELPREGGKKRIVVFTQGALPTLVCVVEDGKVTRESVHDIIKIEESEIVDTNAAGDAFVGGYLSGLAGGDDIDECINKGHYAANTVIQHSSCQFPAEGPSYKKV